MSETTVSPSKCFVSCRASTAGGAEALGNGADGWERAAVIFKNEP
ncbi:hypothetical protein ACSV9I_16675 [Rhizobium sp. G187]